MAAAVRSCTPSLANRVLRWLLTVSSAIERPALKFKIEGPGEIVATDNGDQTSFEPFQVPQRRAFNGLCLVIVRGKPGMPGNIHLTVSSEGLQTATTTLMTTADSR